MKDRRPSDDKRLWTVEMPVKKSDFVALHKSHLSYNIEADLSAMSGYSYASPTRSRNGHGWIRDVVHSDFQTDPAVETFPRLGAGRAGYYRGKYIKGIGRTLLAANWNFKYDTLHSSGHLRVCAAIREYIVTEYLRQKQLSQIIVGCEGVLAKRIDRKLDGFYKVVTKNNEHLVRPADLRFQGLSIKSSDFARFTNFCWLADNRIARPHSIPSFIKHFEYFLAPGNPALKWTFRPDRTSKLLTNAVETLIDNFFACIEIGLNWNAYHNNFAMDGRFIDIEGPLILGDAFVGNLHDRTFNEQFCFPNIGFELIYVLRQIYTALFHIAHRFEETLLINRDIQGETRDMAVDFARILRKHTASGNSIYDWKAIEQRFKKFFDERLALDSLVVKQLLKYGRGVYDFYFHGTDTVPVAKLYSHKSGKKIMSPNTVQKLELRPINGFSMNNRDYDDSETLSEIFDEIECKRSIEGLFSAIEDAKRKLRSSVRPAAKQP